jgi:hypothetical protein
VNEQPSPVTPADPRFADLPEPLRRLLAHSAADVAALDADIEAMLDRQLGLTSRDSLAGPVVRGVHDAVREQRDRMAELRDALGEQEAVSRFKETGATVLGVVTGIVSRIRGDGIARALRDDYATFNLAAIGYTMLLTTARAAGSTHLAQAAERGLAIYASGAQQIEQIMPAVVLAELSSNEGITADASLAAEVREQAARIRNSTDQPMPPGAV